MYNYQRMRPVVFEEKTQRMFLSIRDRAHQLIRVAGSVTLGHAIADECGDSWDQMACVDRLVELEELRELDCGQVRAQDRVFVAGPRAPKIPI